MAQQNINIGTADAKAGDTLFDALTKTQSNFNELFDLGLDNLIPVNDLSGFPAPIGGVITLLGGKEYKCGADIDLGTNRIVMGSGTVLSGIDNAVVTLSRAGTGDLITALNVAWKVKGLTLSTSSGSIFNQSDNTGTIFRVVDCVFSAASFGVFNSSSDSIARFTNVSGAVSSSGSAINGSWSIWLWEVSSVTISLGNWFDIGIATFQAFIADTIVISLAAGANFLKGTAGSANIKPGGIGQVRTILNTGLGTLLDTITIDDALWEFFHNPNIQDTRPDALMSMQGNATNTVISGLGVYALVAGTWVNKGTSQYGFTSAGRLDYQGGKNSKVPLTYSLSAEPVSGNAKIMAFQFAINGVLIPDSKRTGSADAGKPANITMVWQNSFSTNDYVEIFVTNDTDGIHVLVSSAIGRID